MTGIVDNSRVLFQSTRYGQATTSGNSNGSTSRKTTQNNYSQSKQGSYSGGFGQGSEQILNMVQNLLEQFGGNGYGSGSGGSANNSGNNTNNGGSYGSKPWGGNSGGNGIPGWGNNPGWGGNAGGSTKPKPGEYRSIDGTGNNLKNPEWGSTNRPNLRQTIPQDSAREPGGSTEQRLPNPRDVSNAVAAQNGENTVNQKGLSDLFWMWGQFLDHDITLTPTNSAESTNIPIPTGDPQFDPAGTGTASLHFDRSASTTDANGQRQQTNEITAFIDGSNVYGSDAEYAAKLRTHEGGKLVMSTGDMMPMENGQFIAGDVRSNENIGLASMHTLWVREHNRLTDELAQQHPEWTDEQLYQEARKTNVAQMQAITYNEFLPELVGDKAISKYTGYKQNVNPEIDNAFATAAFRLGHTMLSSNLLRLDENGDEIPEGNVALKDAFFRPDKVMEAGIDPILRGAASQTAQAVDPMIVDDVRNFLFGQPGAGGLDLASLNIQRGRDHGLAGYGDAREALGLKPVASFDSPIWRDGFGEKLAQVYDSPADVDLWVAGLAEKPVGDSLFGQTFTEILTDQFTRLRDGDRFWYENQFSGQQLRELQNTKLSDIIARNTDFDNVQENAFVASNIHLDEAPQTGTGTTTDPTWPYAPHGSNNGYSPFTGFNPGKSKMNGSSPFMMPNRFFMPTPQQLFNFDQAIWKGHLG